MCCFGVGHCVTFYYVSPAMLCYLISIIQGKNALISKSLFLYSICLSNFAWVSLPRASSHAVEKDKTIADIVVGAKAPSEAWKILNSMVEDDNSDRARELAKKQFEALSMNDDESMKEYIARAKSLALNIKYDHVEITDHEISHRVLNGLPPLVCSREEKSCFEDIFFYS